MTTLNSYLGAELDNVSDETLILLRLLGRPFARPLNLQSGEDPEDVLRTYLLSANKREASGTQESAPFVGLIQMLLDRPAPDDAAGASPIVSLLEGLDEAARASLAFRVVKLLDASPSIKVDGEALRRIVSKYAPDPQLSGSALSAFWHLLLSRFANEIISDDEIAVCRKAILDPAFINGPIIATARSRPFLFFGTVLPSVFEAVREGALKRNTWPALDAALRAGFLALYADSRNENRRGSHLRLLASQLEELVASCKMTELVENDVAEAVLNCAAQATAWLRSGESVPLTNRMPFADFALLEAGHSRGTFRASSDALGDRKTLDGTIEQTYVKPIRALVNKMGNTVDRSLVTNLVPYAEGVFLEIWQVLMDLSGVAIEMKNIDRDKTVLDLKSGELSFAIWNDYIDKKYNIIGKTIMQTDKPLLTYNKWPLVIRRDILEKFAELIDDEMESALLISALVDGAPIPLEKFVECIALKTLLRKVGIEFVAGTEMEDVVKNAFGLDAQFEQDDEEITSDNSVERLVDGEIGGAFLGGVQADYLTRHFGHTVVTLTEVERETPMHLWFDGDAFASRNYQPVIKPLMQGWKMTCKLLEDSKNSSDLCNWIHTRTSQLNFGVGSAQGGMRTPISSWKALMAIAGKHDTLTHPTKVIGCTANNVTVAPDAAPKLALVAVA